MERKLWCDIFKIYSQDLLSCKFAFLRDFPRPSLRKEKWYVLICTLPFYIKYVMVIKRRSWRNVKKSSEDLTIKMLKSFSVIDENVNTFSYVKTRWQKLVNSKDQLISSKAFWVKIGKCSILRASYPSVSQYEFWYLYI
jgi:hypothetical protein